MTALANAHHDPAHVAAIRAAVSEAHDSGQAMLVFPDLTRRHWASRLTDEFQSGACHAGRYEGSVVLAESPDLVDRGRQAKLAPNPSSLVDAIRRGDRSFAQAGGPQAYFGWPADATADEGRRIIETLGAIIEDAVMEAWESAAPSREHSMTERTSVRGLTIVNPVARRRPRGFSHGILAPPGWRPLAIAGQTAADDDGTVVQLEFAAQFDAALVKVVDVVRAAGGEPHHIARMTVYVTDLDVYRASKMLLGDVWKRRMGSHYPAMALIGVSGLVDRLASVEIEADAMLPPSEDFQ
jgi:enamine deaminase RidA (YjgF/YER057c/UK114 family)